MMTDAVSTLDRSAPRRGASARSGRKARGHGHLRRAEILAAAEQIFLAYGHEGATIRKIADAVGVSSTALYMHFKDKDDILLEITREAFSRLLAQNTQIAVLDMDPVERVRLMLSAYVAFAFENASAYQLVYCAPATQEQAAPPDEVTVLGMRCYELFLGAIEGIEASGRLKSTPPIAAQVSWAAVHGLAALLIARPAFEWADREALVSNMLDGVITGMTT